MIHRVKFISLDEDDKDLVVSFATEDAITGVKSLNLIRTLFFEELLDEEEKGVKVSLEGEYFEEEESNMLSSVRIGDDNIEIKSTHREYHLDIAKIDKTEIDELLELLKKQNYDNRFTIYTA